MDGTAAVGGGLALALARMRLPRYSAAVAAARKAGLPVLDLFTLDEASPQGFYLPDAGLEELADCFAVVDGTRLPLHSQVLGAQSAVLRDLFRSRREGDVAQVRRGRLVVPAAGPALDAITYTRKRVRMMQLIALRARWLTNRLAREMDTLY